MINPGCFGGVQGNLSLHQRVEHAVILAPFLSACLHGVADGVSVKEAVLRPSVYPPKFTKGISDSWRLSFFQNSVQILIFFITDFCELKNFGKKIFLEKKIFLHIPSNKIAGEHISSDFLAGEHISSDFPARIIAGEHISSEDWSILQRGPSLLNFSARKNSLQIIFQRQDNQRLCRTGRININPKLKTTYSHWY